LKEKEVRNDFENDFYYLGEIRMRHEGMADYSRESFYEGVDKLLKD